MATRNGDNYAEVMFDLSTGATSFRMSLPFASAMTVTGQLGGFGGAASTPVRILADTSNDEALFSFTSTTTANATYSFIFGYQVI